MNNTKPESETSSSEGGQIEPGTIAPKPPRVWTSFVAIVLALCLAVLFQALFGIVLAVSELARGVEPSELATAIGNRLVEPYLFIAVVGLGQLAFALAGFLPAVLSPEPFRERVAWRRPRPSWRVYPIAMLSSIAPLAVALQLANLLAKVIPPDESIAKLFAALTVDSAIVFVLFVGIAPGLFEEVLFRGYVQQRLTKRWGPAAAIILSSILFGLLHITPHAITAALPLGFWFGYLAWRSNSILPTILCHFFVNSGLNAWRMVIKFGEPSETAQHVVTTALVVVGAVCFLICCWPSFWRNRPSYASSRNSVE